MVTLLDAFLEDVVPHFTFSLKLNQRIGSESESEISSCLLTLQGSLIIGILSLKTLYLICFTWSKNGWANQLSLRENRGHSYEQVHLREVTTSFTITQQMGFV